ncbi:MAG: hypothetical protein LAT68_12735 [Cyclobacteriaceae bacterium]|nr:hypothetical protein [Cyclobacteriaceae bacterium]
MDFNLLNINEMKKLFYALVAGVALFAFGFASNSIEQSQAAGGKCMYDDDGGCDSKGDIMCHSSACDGQTVTSFY